jgi:hypothetical protein
MKAFRLSEQKEIGMNHLAALRNKTITNTAFKKTDHSLPIFNRLILSHTAC